MLCSLHFADCLSPVEAHSNPYQFGIRGEHLRLLSCYTDRFLNCCGPKRQRILANLITDEDQRADYPEEPDALAHRCPLGAPVLQHDTTPLEELDHRADTRASRNLRRRVAAERPCSSAAHHHAHPKREVQAECSGTGPLPCATAGPSALLTQGGLVGVRPPPLVAEAEEAGGIVV